MGTPVGVVLGPLRDQSHELLHKIAVLRCNGGGLEDELPSRLCPPNRGVAVRRNPVNAEVQLERHTLPGLQAGPCLRQRSGGRLRRIR